MLINFSNEKLLLIEMPTKVDRKIGLMVVVRNTRKAKGFKNLKSLQNTWTNWKLNFKLNQIFSNDFVVFGKNFVALSQ